MRLFLKRPKIMALCLRPVSLFTLLSLCALDIPSTGLAQNLSAAPGAGGSEGALQRARQLPAELAKAEEFFEPEDAVPDRPSVIYVQDAHLNFDAARSIWRVIEFFQKNGGIDLVALEGGEGRLDDLFFRAFPDAEVKEKVLTEYLRRGELSGVEAALIAGAGGSVPFYGVEDQGLYDQNKRAFLEGLAATPRIRSFLAEEERKIFQQAEGLNNPQVVKFIANQRTYFQNQEQSGALLAYLHSLSEQYVSLTHRSLPELFSEVEKVLHLKETLDEGGKTEDAHARELEAAFALLTPGLSREEAMILNREAQEWRTGRDAGRFAGILIDTAKSLSIDISLSPEVRRSAELYRSLQSMEGARLFEQIEELKKELRKHLPAGISEKKVMDDFHRFALLSRMSRFQLSRNEWTELKTLDLEAAAELFSPHVRFYRLAEQRDRVLLENALNLSRARGARTVLLITGGFHAGAVTGQMKAEKIPYVLLRPAMTEAGGEERYFEIMQGGAEYMRYFRGSLWDALAQDYVRRVAAQLTPQQKAPLLKEWRDQIMRGAVVEERLPEAGNFIRYLDDLPGFESSGLVPDPREKIDGALDDFLRAYFRFLSGPRAGALGPGASLLSAELALIPVRRAAESLPPRQRPAELSAARSELRGEIEAILLRTKLPKVQAEPEKGSRVRIRIGDEVDFTLSKEFYGHLQAHEDTQLFYSLIWLGMTGTAELRRALFEMTPDEAGRIFIKREAGGDVLSGSVVGFRLSKPLTLRNRKITQLEFWGILPERQGTEVEAQTVSLQGIFPDSPQGEWSWHEQSYELPKGALYYSMPAELKPGQREKPLTKFGTVRRYFKLMDHAWENVDSGFFAGVPVGMGRSKTFTFRKYPVGFVIEGVNETQQLADVMSDPESRDEALHHAGHNLRNFHYAGYFHLRAVKGLRFQEVAGRTWSILHSHDFHAKARELFFGPEPTREAVRNLVLYDLVSVLASLYTDGLPEEEVLRAMRLFLEAYFQDVLNLQSQMIINGLIDNIRLGKLDALLRGIAGDVTGRGERIDPGQDDRLSDLHMLIGIQNMMVHELITLTDEDLMKPNAVDRLIRAQSRESVFYLLRSLSLNLGENDDLVRRILPALGNFRGFHVHRDEVSSTPQTLIGIVDEVAEKMFGRRAGISNLFGHVIVHKNLVLSLQNQLKIVIRFENADPLETEAFARQLDDAYFAALGDPVTHQSISATEVTENGIEVTIGVAQANLSLLWEALSTRQFRYDEEGYLRPLSREEMLTLMQDRAELLKAGMTDDEQRLFEARINFRDSEEEVGGMLAVLKDPNLSEGRGIPTGSFESGGAISRSWDTEVTQSLEGLKNMGEANAYFAVEISRYVKRFNRANPRQPIKKNIYLARGAGGVFLSKQLMRLFLGRVSGADNELFFLSRDFMGWDRSAEIVQVMREGKDAGENYQQLMERALRFVHDKYETDPVWKAGLDAIYNQLNKSGFLNSLNKNETLLLVDELADGSLAAMFRYIVERRSAEEGRPLHVDFFMGAPHHLKGVEGYPGLNAAELSANYGLSALKGNQLVYFASYGSAMVPHPFRFDSKAAPTPVVDDSLPILPERAEVLLASYLRSLVIYNKLVDFYANITVTPLLEIARSGELDAGIRAEAIKAAGFSANLWAFEQLRELLRQEKDPEMRGIYYESMARILREAVPDDARPTRLYNVLIMMEAFDASKTVLSPEAAAEVTEAIRYNLTSDKINMLERADPYTIESLRPRRLNDRVPEEVLAVAADFIERFEKRSELRALDPELQAHREGVLERRPLMTQAIETLAASGLANTANVGNVLRGYGLRLSGDLQGPLEELAGKAAAAVPRASLARVNPGETAEMRRWAGDAVEAIRNLDESTVIVYEIPELGGTGRPEQLQRLVKTAVDALLLNRASLRFVAASQNDARELKRLLGRTRTRGMNLTGRIFITHAGAPFPRDSLRPEKLIVTQRVLSDRSSFDSGRFASGERISLQDENILAEILLGALQAAALKKDTADGLVQRDQRIFFRNPEALSRFAFLMHLLSSEAEKQLAVLRSA